MRGTSVFEGIVLIVETIPIVDGVVRVSGRGVTKLAPALEALGAGVYGGISGHTSDWEALPIPISDDRYGPAMAVKSAVVVDTGSRMVSVARCWRGRGSLGGPISVTVWDLGHL